MQIGAGILAFALAAAALAPSAYAETAVGGKGPHVRAPDGSWKSFSGRPVVIVDDRFADFGHKQVATAPPLQIRVVGDVEIEPLEDGGLRIRFLDE